LQQFAANFMSRAFLKILKHFQRFSNFSSGSVRHDCDMTMRRLRPEDQIQRALFEHIRSRGVAGLVAVHVPNGGHRRPVEAAIMKGVGVTAGTPDILLSWADKSFALEIKDVAGRFSDAQADMLARLSQAGVDRGRLRPGSLDILERWLLLKGSVQ
jgi:hypothetical protein